MWIKFETFSTVSIKVDYKTKCKYELNYLYGSEMGQVAFIPVASAASNK